VGWKRWLQEFFWIWARYSGLRARVYGGQILRPAGQSIWGPDTPACGPEYMGPRYSGLQARVSGLSRDVSGQGPEYPAQGPDTPGPPRNVSGQGPEYPARGPDTPGPPEMFLDRGQSIRPEGQILRAPQKCFWTGPDAPGHPLGFFSGIGPDTPGFRPESPGCFVHPESPGQRPEYPAVVFQWVTVGILRGL